jgi:hypothetical protein
VPEIEVVPPTAGIGKVFRGEEFISKVHYLVSEYQDVSTLSTDTSSTVEVPVRVELRFTKQEPVIHPSHNEMLTLELQDARLVDFVLQNGFPVAINEIP